MSERSREGATLIMGLDVGTTRVKAVVHTVDGDAVASASTPTPWVHDGTGMQTQAELVRRVVLDVAGLAAARALADRPRARVAAIGVTGMGEAGVLTDAADRVLAPVRAWHDGRGDVEQLRRAIGEPDFLAAAGVPLTAQVSLAKILTLRAEDPGVAAAQRFWSVPEWAVRCLGGTPGSELSLASRTGLLDVVENRPWPAAIDLLGADLLGPLHSASTGCGVAGGPGVPAALHGAVLAVAGHDHQSAAYAVDAVRDGLLLDSLGTAEALLRFTTGPVTRELVAGLAGQGITVGRTVVPGYFCVLGGLLVGMGLERIASAIGVTTREGREALGQAALRFADPPGTAAVQMVGDSVVVRLDAELEPAGLWARAVHDLVGGADPVVARIRAAVGIESRVLGTGGWLANPAVLAAKRRQFPALELSALAEAGAAGAARLAGEAAGVLPARPLTEPAAGSSPSWARGPAEPLQPFREVTT